MSDLVEPRVNEIADQLANEGMIVRASRVREAAVEISRQRIEIKRLRAALEFYANPETYFALMMMADPPCGDFVRDFSVVPGAYTDRPMPGDRARSALEPKP